ncbi:MAG: hypothetical protein HYV26_00595 [Candidatus Hydrogenedentes bacterium]|nr:hypothetical protein [Candidatus Hydrogenedentota bacterium]
MQPARKLQDELLKQGRAVGEVRACLDEAARQMSVPAEPPYPAVADTGMKPSTWAGITFAVVVLLALLLYALVDPAPLIFVCLVGVGGIAAVMARDWRLGQLFRARERLLSEYPSQLCRHYVQALPEQIAAYESVASATQAPAEAAASAM